MKAFVDSWAFWSSGEDFRSVPDLSFLPSRMKRRMSQLSRMIIEIGHTLIQGCAVDDVIFASRYGELNRQLEITEGILDKNEVSPAAFSQSVFNTPVALVSLHEKIKGTTRAICAGEESFMMGLLQSILLSGTPGVDRVLYLYGDESIPDVYEALVDEPSMPMALGMLISGEIPERSDGTITLELKPSNTEYDVIESAAAVRKCEGLLRGTEFTDLCLNSSGFSINLINDRP